jgi:DNA-binding HxlR family transcriptional regulator
MKNIISGLNKIFDSRIKLGIMAVLSVNSDLDFNALKELLDITDGNLASHLKTLEKHGLIETKKQFVGRKPNTSYAMTTFGKRVFREHLDALEKIIHPVSTGI